MRPFQIWLVFLLCLAVVLPAMGWLTQQTLESDRAEWQAKHAAEREEVVASVLWQMDAELTTLMAQEAARPHFVYSPFYTVPGVVASNEKGGKTPKPAATDAKPAKDDWPVSRKLPSPLLLQPSPYVLLHFQVSADGKLTSPQVPVKDRELAIDNGTTLANIERSEQLEGELAKTLKYDALAALLPSDKLPEVGIGQWQFNNNIPNSDVVGNSLDFPPVQQELEEFNQAAPNSPPNFTAAPQGQQAANPAGNAERPSAYDNAYAVNARNQRDGSNDLQQRNRAYQSAAQQQVRVQRMNYATPELKFVSESVSQPLWLDGRLMLARRVKIGETEAVQGCWLDWPKIQSELAAQHAETLPGVSLQPVRRDSDRSQIKVSRLLATVPAQLVVPEVVLPAQPWSPMRSSLLVAWSMLALATVAVAVLLQGVITLSERRGAFVSAVTHELRTPLTTFRMYAEMLAENMVPAPEMRQRYLDTLRVEADRLSHLVENVLAYARLERGRKGRRREATSLSQVIDRSQQRFADRAAQAEMKLVIEPVDESAGEESLVQTDPAAVEQILFNLIDNACKYAVAASDKRIHVSQASSGQFAVVRVSDHGPGINAKAARRLFQPFSKSVHDAACSAPGVGLGLALSRRLAQELGGRLELERRAGEGATFALYLPK